MKHLLRLALTAVVLLFMSRPDAQAGLNTYSFSQSSGTYTALTTANILTMGVMEFVVPLPFRFRVDTVSNDTLFININGYAALRKDRTVFGPTTPLPLASNLQYSGVMAPFATNLYPGFTVAPSGAIRYDTTGTAPNRIFIVDWQNKLAGAGYTVSFQLKLHEGTNIVQFVYGSIPSTNSSSLSGQVGLRSVDTGIQSGGVIGRTNIIQLTSSSYQYVAWTATAPLKTSNWYSSIYTYPTPHLKPASGLTYTWTPAPSCNATAGAGTLLPDSATVCYGSTATLEPAGTRDSLRYQWQSSNNNGATWTNYTGPGAQFLNLTTAPVTGTILYRQQATCLKNSAVTYTNPVKLQHLPALSVPWYEGFEAYAASNSQLSDCMSIFPNNGIPIVLSGTGARTGTRYSRFFGNPRSWIITPGFNLVHGKTYRLAFWYNSSGTDSIRIAVGTFPHPDSIRNVASVTLPVKQEFMYRRTSFTFTVPAAGRYFAGINWNGSGSNNYLDDIQLIEEPAQDVAIDTFINPKVPTCFNSATPVTVRVRNTGTDTLRNVPVSFSVGTTKYGPETIGGAIAPGADTLYTFVQKASLTGIYTIYDLRAWSSLAGDGFLQNDTSYAMSLRTDTLHAVPYTQPFDNLFSLGNAKWNGPGFSSGYSQMYTNYGWKNTSYFYYWYIHSIPAGGKDSISTTPFGPIHANTFMTFDYRIVDFGSGPNPKRMTGGDTMYVLAAVNCNSGRDTLLKIHAGNQFFSDSFKTIPPVFLGAYAGQIIRISFVMKKDSAGSTTNPQFFHLDNFKLQDMKPHDIGILAIEPRPGVVACTGSPVPVKVVISNGGGFSQSGFPIRLLAGASATPAITFTYTGVLHFGKTDTVTIGSVTSAVSGPLPLKVFVAISGDTTRSNDTLSSVVHFADTAAAPQFSNRTICIGDTVILDAGANDSTEVFWYNSATSSMPFSFISPRSVNPSATTTYYAARRTTRKGRAGKPAFTSSFGSASYTYGLRLDALSDLMLDSMAIYPTGSGSITVSVLSCASCSSPATLGSNTYSFTGATGARVMVPVKIYVPQGNGYLIAGTAQTGTLSLMRDFPYSGYPLYSSTAPLVIPSGWGNGQAQFDGYYFFYDMVVKAEACESARMPVTIIVDPKPVPSFTGSRAGATVTLTNRSSGGGTYFWDFGDGDTSSDFSPVHTYKANGTYVVRLYQTNPCGIDSAVQSVIIIGVGGIPGTPALSALQLYPNPSSGQFTLTFTANKAGPVRLTIYNAIGAQVSDGHYELGAGPQKITKDIAGLPAGAYRVLLQADGRQQSLPLILTAK